MVEGEDYLRKLQLRLRKTSLERLLARPRSGLTCSGRLRTSGSRIAVGEPHPRSVVRLRSAMILMFIYRAGTSGWGCSAAGRRGLVNYSAPRIAAVFAAFFAVIAPVLAPFLTFFAAFFAALHSRGLCLGL